MPIRKNYSKRFQKEIIEARSLIGIVNIDDFYKLTPFEYECLKKGAIQARFLPQTLYQPAFLIEKEGVEKADNNLKEMLDNQTQHIYDLFEKTDEERQEEAYKENLLRKFFMKKGG